jgi:Mn-dependent DtxR family transcriptional regulator
MGYLALPCNGNNWDTVSTIRGSGWVNRQEFMAMMLGVHRPTVSTAASMLQHAGLITYSRGQMRIIDVASVSS